ncbi:MAG: hypothetical protein R8M11_00375 [Gallionella sp.]
MAAPKLLLALLEVAYQSLNLAYEWAVAWVLRVSRIETAKALRGKRIRCDI